MKRSLIFALTACTLFINNVLHAEELSTGQTLYLPVYSYIWHGDRVGSAKIPAKSLVSALVSVRNTSLKHPIRVTSARYYSTDGKLVKDYLPQPAMVGAMGTLELFVERREAEGGSGANFVIQWEASNATNPPIVEAIHADFRGGSHGIIFLTKAQPILPENK